jgi:hypothetical protein
VGGGWARVVFGLFSTVEVYLFLKETDVNGFGEIIEKSDVFDTLFNIFIHETRAGYYLRISNLVLFKNLNDIFPSSESILPRHHNIQENKFIALATLIFHFSEDLFFSLDAAEHILIGNFETFEHIR